MKLKKPGLRILGLIVALMLPVMGAYASNQVTITGNLASGNTFSSNEEILDSGMVIDQGAIITFSEYKLEENGAAMVDGTTTSWTAGDYYVITGRDDNNKVISIQKVYPVTVYASNGQSYINCYDASDIDLAELWPMEEKPGYTLKGFSLTSGGAVADSVTLRSDSMTELYAVWEASPDEEPQTPVTPDESGEKEEAEQQEPIVLTAKNSYGMFQEETVAGIKHAPADKNFEIETDNWISFKKNVYEELDARTDIAKVIKFKYKGKRYMITIPAGETVADLCDKNGYAGFLYLGTKFGMTEIK